VAPISHTLDTTGLIARNVEDCALIDKIVTGEQSSELSIAGVKGVRLAYAPRQFLDLVEPDVDARFSEVVKRLRNAGAEVVELDLGDDFNPLSQTATWCVFLHETIGAVSEFLCLCRTWSEGDLATDHALRCALDRSASELLDRGPRGEQPGAG
jgi:Asp-tRNA(Asn)/Glu-tRNA(Gln) amidotransferase A subunit family amidase